MKGLGVVLVLGAVGLALAAAPAFARETDDEAPDDDEEGDDDGETETEIAAAFFDWAIPPAPVAPPVAPPLAPMILTGRAAALPPSEQTLILDVAERKGIDPAALAALRVAEHGGPGREFGVLSIPAPTIRDQAEVAAQSIRNHEGRYRTATNGKEPRGADGRYTDDFLRHFSARYAPIDADNDPRGLNRHHAGNLLRAYHASGVVA